MCQFISHLIHSRICSLLIGDTLTGQGVALLWKSSDASLDFHICLIFVSGGKLGCRSSTKENCIVVFDMVPHDILLSKVERYRLMYGLFGG